MPGYYKWPAYVGNALLLVVGLIVVTSNSVWIGGPICALAALNIYLVWKLDVFSREEVYLELEIKKAKMREELLDLERKLKEEASAPTTPPQIAGPQSTRPS